MDPHIRHERRLEPIITLPASDGFEERHRPQGDLAIQGSLSLLKKYGPRRYGSPEDCTSIHEMNLPTEQVNSNEGDRLHSCLLPLLKQQLTTIKELLEHSGLHRKPEEVQSAFDRNMDQIQSVFAAICPEPFISAPQRVDDHQPRQFKAHRLNELVKRIDQVKGDIATLLHRSYSQLHRMKLSTGVSPYRRYDRGYSERWDEEVLDNINSTIICSKGSESDLAEDRWRYQVLGMDVELRDIIRLAEIGLRTTHSAHEVHDPTHKAIPALFPQINRTDTKKEEAAVIIDRMNSDQLKCLCDSAYNVNSDLFNIVDHSDAPGMDLRNGYKSRPFITLVETLARHLGAIIHVVVTYVVPLITDPDDLPDQNDFKSWLMTWNTQLSESLEGWPRSMSHGREGAQSIPPIEELLPIDLVNSKEGLMDWLQSCLLPVLKQHVTTILVLLDPSGLRAEPTAKLMRILAQQSVYDRDMARMQSAINIICPQPMCDRGRVDDHQLKRFKSYSLEELLDNFQESQNHIVSLFGDACKDLQQMKLCTDESTYALALPGAWHGWLVEVIVSVGNPSFDPDTLLSRVHYDVMGRRRRLVREPIIQLTKSVIPLIKLARIFYRKLFKHKINRKQLPLYTDMNSQQLECISDSAFDVEQDLIKLVKRFGKADLTTRGAANTRSRGIDKLIDTIASRLEAALHLVVLYLVPLIPESDGLPGQNYFNTWFMTWNTQFVLAIHNVKYLVELPLTMASCE
ncbi:hypothetical protein PSHT_11985 [Puccinia striiformis]|uniref:Uncharacterized protein n=1 Tax=Puccinia striiformis TaxID=27350 RepID=A0A2S4UZS2_9BASI|nr:hypothetical protein PSHT_11985 [Puccinia striiformis]